MDTYKRICAKLVEAWDDTADGEYEDFGRDASYLVDWTRAELAKPEPEPPTDEEIMALMPQQMHEDLAFAARAMAEHAGTDSTRAKGLMRIMLNRHVVDLVRAALARWGK